jgi:hypothetical protein
MSGRSDPAWQAELWDWVTCYVGGSDTVQDGAMASLQPHIDAAYERGLVAGRSQGRYTTGRKKWRKEKPCATAGAGAASPTPVSTTEAGDEP